MRSASGPAALALLLLLGCGGPFLLLPGGMLEGAATPPPARWNLPDGFTTGQLETRPADPYSINIVFTVVDGKLYVNAGDGTRWVEHLASDPRVRVSLDTGLHELRAARVTDAEELAAFARAWTAQSTFRRDPLDYDEVFVYRLEAREG